MLRFLIYFAEKSGEIIGVFSQTTAIFAQKINHNIGLREKRQFFRLKLAKKSQRIVFITSTPVLFFIDIFYRLEETVSRCPNFEGDDCTLSDIFH
jgi:hypothetical protein